VHVSDLDVHIFSRQYTRTYQWKFSTGCL